ncbi:hypothetical protein AVEN_156988-1, partial [Araneus ventricosus]
MVFRCFSGGLVVRSQVQRLPASQPVSAEDPACMRPVAHQLMHSSQPSSRYC